MDCLRVEVSFLGVLMGFLYLKVVFLEMSLLKVNLLGMVVDLLVICL